MSPYVWLSGVQLVTDPATGLFQEGQLVRPILTSVPSALVLVVPVVDTDYFSLSRQYEEKSPSSYFLINPVLEIQ